VAWRGGDGRLHYYRKPGIAPRGHAAVAAELAEEALRRLRYPNDLRRRVVSIVRGHMFDIGRGDALRARRFLWRYGDDLAADLLDHKEADLRGKAGDPSEVPVQQLERLAAFRLVVDEQRSSPHRLRDLAVDGDDLLALGYKPGPKVGLTLGALLEAVINEPALNVREKLLERAEALR